MSDVKPVQLRISSELKGKVEYLAAKTNRSVNGMIAEMIESYSVGVGGRGMYMGMSPQEYAEYIKHTFGDVQLFNFSISTKGSDYSSDMTLPISEACTVSDESGAYLLVDNDEILYAGSSVSLKSRMSARKSNGWIATGNDKAKVIDPSMRLSDSAVVMFWFTSEYRSMERDLIYSISPKFNIATPKHDGGEFMISTEKMRDVMKIRINESICDDEIKSLERLLLMKCYN